MNKPVVVLLAVVVAIGVLIAGCGGSSDNGSESSTLTKAEFLKQGNAICAKGNDEIEAGFESFVQQHHMKKNQRPTAAELKGVAEEVLVPIISRQVKEIRALGTPEGDEQKVEGFLTAAEEALEKAEQNPSILTQENNDPFEAVNKKAASYGLTKCAEE